MLDKGLCFGYKGGRDYVHGTDIFNKLAGLFDLDSQTPLSISFHKIIRSPSLLLSYSSRKQDLSEGEGEKVAHGFFDKGGERTHFVLAEVDPGDCPGESRPYDEQSIADRSTIEGQRVLISDLGEYSFIENVVALNKHLLQTLFPDKDGKWLFTRVELEGVPSDDGSIELELLHNLNFKLTKTQVVCGGAPAGNIYFTMVPK